MGDDGAWRCSCESFNSAGSTAVNTSEGAGAGITKGPGKEYNDLCRFRTVFQWRGSSFAEVHRSKAQPYCSNLLMQVSTNIRDDPTYNIQTNLSTIMPPAHSPDHTHRCAHVCDGNKWHGDWRLIQRRLRSYIFGYVFVLLFACRFAFDWCSSSGNGSMHAINDGCTIIDCTPNSKPQ